MVSPHIFLLVCGADVRRQHRNFNIVSTAINSDKVHRRRDNRLFVPCVTWVNCNILSGVECDEYSVRLWVCSLNFNIILHYVRKARFTTSCIRRHASTLNPNYTNYNLTVVVDVGLNDTRTFPDCHRSSSDEAY